MDGKWGAFSQGLMGGMQTVGALYGRKAEIEQQQEQLKMQKETNALQQEHMNLVNDASKFDAALKVIEKSPDIAATQNYIDKIQLKNPFYKDTLSAYAIADAGTKRELKDFATEVNKLITTPSSDAFSKAELKLAEAGARFGADSNTYKSLKATLDIMKDAYGRDVTPKLVQQIDLGWQTMQKLGKEQPPSTGLLQQQPGISDEELNAVNSFKTNLAELSRWSKPEYDRIVGQYGLNKPAKAGKQIERTIDLGDKQRVIYTDGTEEDLPKGVSPNTAIRINMGDQRGDARFAMNLRKEFNAIQPVKDYRDITTKYNVMTEAFKESKTTKNYVAVDQALITLYNKMTDPASVVRESEYVRTPQDMAIMDRAEAAMIRVGKGGRLEPDTRQAIMTMAGKFKKAYESKYNEIANEYRGYASSSGIEPDNVVKQVKEEKQQTRNISKAVTYLKSSKDRNDAKNRMKALMSASGEEGIWTDEELREIERQAGY